MSIDDEPVELDAELVRRLAILGATKGEPLLLSGDSSLWITLEYPDNTHPLAVSAVAQGIVAALKNSLGVNDNDGDPA